VSRLGRAIASLVLFGVALSLRIAGAEADVGDRSASRALQCVPELSEEQGARSQLIGHYRSQGRQRLALLALDVNQRHPFAANDPQVQLQRASVLLDMGRAEEALRLLEELNTGEKVQFDLSLLNQHGRALALTGDWARAAQKFELARGLAIAAGQHQSAARASINRTRAQIDGKELLGLEANLRLARTDVAEVADGNTQGSLLVSLADLYRRAVAELQLPEVFVTESREMLEIALAETRDVETLGYAYGFLGALHEVAGRPDAALVATRKALRHAESIDSMAQVYRWEWQRARLLRATEKPAEALRAIERAIFLLSEFRDDVVPRSANAFTSLVAPVYTEYADLLLQQSTDLEDLDARQVLYRQARRTLESLKTAEVEDYFATRCLTRAPVTEGAGVKGEAILYPIILNARLELLLETGGELHRVSVAVDRRDINETIRQFRLNLERPATGEAYRTQALKLYQWIIEPLSAALEDASVETLVIVPDGALRTIPLAALHDGEQFLIEQFALATTPAYQLTQSLARAPVTQFLAGGLTQSVQGFSKLPNVAREIDEIVARFPAHELRDERFRLEAVSAGLSSSEYNMIHLATHGEFKADYKRSFILTHDSRLTLDRLQALLSARGSTPLDLLVLSACQTAAGDERAALGLAGVAVQSGAKSAVASLWSISDASTAELFSVFYAELAKTGSSKARSLQLAQLALLRNANFGHPSFWAPYLLIGSWT